MNLKARLKPIVLHLWPQLYHRRLIRQSRAEMNVNTQLVKPVLAIPYDYFGKYPTMYDEPQDFYYRRKEQMLFDEQGIPMLAINGKSTYHPVYLIQYALSEYGFYLSTKTNEHFQTAQKIGDWLVTNQNAENGCWSYHYEYLHVLTNCLIKAPWYSAMAQGQAISLLVRLHYVTKNDKYLNAALKALRLLDIPVSAGGLSSELFGHIMYEEFPTTPNSYTLNGFMFCALGLYDLSQACNDMKVSRLWQTARDTLKFVLPLYDGDLMSIYCLSYLTTGKGTRKWADGYHAIHINLLQCFQSFMPDPTIAFYIKRWAGFLGIKIRE